MLFSGVHVLKVEHQQAYVNKAPVTSVHTDITTQSCLSCSFLSNAQQQARKKTWNWPNFEISFSAIDDGQNKRQNQKHYLD